MESLQRKTVVVRLVQAIVSALVSSEVLRWLAQALTPYLKEAFEGSVPPRPDFYDQHNSPLGRRRHLRLVREGVLPGRKVGRLRLVKSADIVLYIDSHGEAVGVGDEDDDVLRSWGLRSQGRTPR